MKDVALLSDAELAGELRKYNVSVGPVTGTTRSLYEKKLAKLLKQGPPSATNTSPQKTKVNPSASFGRNNTYKLHTNALAFFLQSFHNLKKMTLFSYNYTPSSQIIPGLYRTDRPGATPPRNATLAGSRGLLDLGRNDGDDDDEDDYDGQESSRVVYTTNVTGPEKRSPLRKAWDNLLGYDFKAGKVPGSNYELRHGSTRTRVDRDPKTGRIRVQQQSIGRDISTILVIVLSVFFVMLAVAYLGTARQESLRSHFNIYQSYPILAIAVVLAIYFGHKKWNQLKEKEEAALTALFLDIVREANENGEEYISIPHVRDVMFPPAKRRGAELARWERAVDFINANESRISTETRVLRGGQECDVWRWIPKWG
ncbi:unnamed protein product [Haemonchus placei]|uniref:LEM domain-containing protein n=1 Tax=Haemonchus placei TaxID=6290 RepID=A0A0N4W2I2_HAEPC|nr:unnamed protein product [Haemonchus placei]